MGTNMLCTVKLHHIASLPLVRGTVGCRGSVFIPQHEIVDVCIVVLVSVSELLHPNFENKPVYNN